MEMIPVRSSAIRAVGYDQGSMRMRILFTQGHSYDFCRVPADVYRGLMSAPSMGSYYNNVIKDRYHC
ncbi:MULTISPECIES: KTSC domain-containing protein [Burkholderia cepacia complex]|uniref:KTSC domain-containing protein n=1 Tax=Burkholderia cepacia complex TaxID=87882 RepID=UPI000F585D02|nr:MULTISPECIES: KTSC domain-containing protein [Burkholderia cepacia complex]RQT78109.1 KTSC domain-containing protein [Burkholderia cepacia]RQZ64216.1 KTSC domain-containing protein [Burkholderia cepacia]